MYVQDRLSTVQRRFAQFRDVTCKRRFRPRMEQKGTSNGVGDRTYLEYISMKQRNKTGGRTVHGVCKRDQYNNEIIMTIR